MLKTICYTFLAIIVSCAQANADIYKWTDAKGTLHFSDDAPASGNYETIPEKSTPVISNLPSQTQPLPENQPQTPGEQGTAASLKPATPSQTKSAPASETGIPQRCAGLIIEIDTLKRTEAVYQDERGRFHTHKSPFSRFYEGNREYLDDATRSAALTFLQEEKDQWCKDDKKSQRKYSIALHDLLERRQCDLIQQRLKELKQPKYRTANSTIREIEKYLHKECQQAAKLR